MCRRRQAGFLNRPTILGFSVFSCSLPPSENLVVEAVVGLALVVSLVVFVAVGSSSPSDGGRARGRGLGIVVALAFLLGLSGIVFAGLGAPLGCSVVRLVVILALVVVLAHSLDCVSRGGCIYNCLYVYTLFPFVKSL